MNEGQLYRSRTDQIVGGVCGGLANYLRIDSTLVRLLFVLLGLGSGVGVAVYLILWIIIPYPSTGEAGSTDNVRSSADELGQRAREMGADLQRNLRQPSEKTVLVIGAVLVFMGVYILLRNLGLPWMRWFDVDFLWPLALVVVGVALALRHVRK
jgi:phage shock protein C